MSLGKSIVRQFGEDAQYWSEPQFHLFKTDHNWRVVHNNKAKNETMLNGKSVTDSASLKDGDQLAVGRESKGIVKLPLQVRINRSH
jgi:eukaryotic-like serine/threonine-protein kinase